MLKKEKFVSVNPETGKEVCNIEAWTLDRIQSELQQSENDYKYWKNKTLEFRLDQITKVKSELEEKRLQLAEIITIEVGKPISQSISEIDKCIGLCDYYIHVSEKVLKNKILKDSPFDLAEVSYDPLGGILGIMPWNFPFWQVFRFALPAIISGNVVWLKHSPNVSICNLEIEKMFNTTLDIKIYRAAFIEIRHLDFLLEQNHIQGTSLTGSEKAGSSLASLSGKHIKKTLLELGGNDALLICEDADLKKAAEKAIFSRMINTGQTCISTKRVYIPKKQSATILPILKRELNTYTRASLAENTTKIGLMARYDLVESLFLQIEKLENFGFQLIHKVGEDDGLFVAPRIYFATNKVLFDEELFGPILVVYEFDDLDNVIEDINKSKYGLGTSIWTENKNLALKIAKTIDVGSIVINNIVQSNAFLPFGGIKKSGFGRELSENALLEFVNHKVIYS